MKILHIINDLATGGTEHLLVKHVQQLARVQPGHDHRVIVLGSAKGASAEYLARLPVPPTYLGFSGRYRDPVATASCLWRLRRLLGQSQPDLVHSYLWNANVFSELARRGRGIPHAVHVVDRRGDRDAKRFVARAKVRLTGRLLCRGDMRFAAVSEACREHAIRQWQIDPRQIVTAHNGIPAAEFDVRERPIVAGRAPVVGTISNFKAEKGHRYLLEGMALLRDQGVPFELRVAGGGRGVDRAALEALVERLGLGEWVQFIGRVPSAAAFYRDIDLFVIPSIFAEGLPTTILEAMAARLPVVATDVGGAIEAVRDGIEGLIVPPRDPGALAQAVAALVADPERMRAMGEAGARRVREAFSIERMTATILEQVYQPLLDAAAGH